MPMIRASDLANPANFISRRDSLSRVSSARQWAETAHLAVRDAVAESRSMNTPWSDIAAALGMTESLAQARYEL